MKGFFRAILMAIREEEDKLTLHPKNIVSESRRMIVLINDKLEKLKDYVLKHEFDTEEDEIVFFKETKPTVFGKLLYYNKMYRIEVAKPIDLGGASKKYFSKKLRKLEKRYINDISPTGFYRYYRSGLTHKDQEYFVRGRINLLDGLRSRAFEFDPRLSTYYDHEVALIIERDLLYEYLHFRIDNHFQPLSQKVEKLSWTESKNAMIELIYALHASQSIENGKLGIRKIVSLFQTVFDVQLGDVHHAFHRMKYRSNNSYYLDKLRASLDAYIEKDL